MGKDFSFKEFLLNEREEVLAHRVGDIVNAVEDINSNAPNVGARVLVKRAEAIVNQIRSILHTHWPREQEKHLKTLQKIGVAIMRAIEQKSDLKSVVAGVGQELEKVVGKLGKPLHGAGTSGDTIPDAGEDLPDPTHKSAAELDPGGVPGQKPDDAGQVGLQVGSLPPPKSPQP